MLSSRPELERPILIAAFRGWNDGGQGASLATGYLAKLWNARRFAEIEPENFFDFQATRPHVSLEEGRHATHRLALDRLLPRRAAPDSTVTSCSCSGSSRISAGARSPELIVGFSSELQHRAGHHASARCSQTSRTLARALSPGSASDPELVERLGLSASRYEGPTGIVGVLHDACRQADLPSASLWAAVPHYVSLDAEPEGCARAL